MAHALQRGGDEGADALARMLCSFGGYANVSIGPFAPRDNATTPLPATLADFRRSIDRNVQVKFILEHMHDPVSVEELYERCQRLVATRDDAELSAHSTDSESSS